MARKNILIFLIILFCSIASVLFCPTSSPAQADTLSEEEKGFLSLYFKEDELVVISTTRSLKSITRVAENVEVITAEDIELMNAHTLADVLKNVNGVQLEVYGRTPGMMSPAMIQGSDLAHVAVFLDGILVNFLNSNVADLSHIPVQMIEKVEIIKGPASSVWGSSLGGIINVITKTPGSKEKMGGMVSASYGERDTGDLRAEIYGRAGKRFGFYLSAGGLETDGFRPNEDQSNRNVYTKITYDITTDTKALFTFMYFKKDEGRSESVSGDWSDRDETENLLSTLSLESALSKDVKLSLALKALQRNFSFFTDILSSGEQVFMGNDYERRYVASAKLTWKHGINNIVIGSDYNEDVFKSNQILQDRVRMRNVAVFANDTITIGRLSITPGMRYDNTDATKDFISPSLGLTYEAGKNILFRAYVARGFNNPSVAALLTDGPWYVHNPDIKPEKVWSYQLGVEANILDYLWIKASGFRHDIKDGMVWSDQPNENGQYTLINKTSIRRQGIEIGFRTRQVYHFTLFGSALFIKTEDRDTGEEIKDCPTNTYDIGIKYDNKNSFRALLTGHYIWWNTFSYNNGKYSSFVFDLNMIKTIYKNEKSSMEAFLTAHNIFNASQYSRDFYKNTRRWIEGGIRLKF